MKLWKIIWILLPIFLLNFVVIADVREGDEFISFGADLDQAQRDLMFEYFNPQNRPKIIEVTNAEERSYLQKYIPLSQIGTRAISSIYIRNLSGNSGIKIETKNITWVTAGMYANAVSTAGVKDVLIKAGAPFPVSGTAALTGIFKTFEVASGKTIDSSRKDVAYQELVTTGDLGGEIGQDNAEVLIRDIKKDVIENKSANPEEIRIITKNNANKYNITLTEEQIQRIEELMNKINHLNLNIEEISNQLQNLNTRVKGIEEEGKKVSGVLAQIIAILQQIFDFIKSIFS